MTKKTLFTEFAPVTEKAFKQKIHVDLKGEDYNDTLVWKSPEGIHVKPFYHRESSAHFQVDMPEKWHVGEDIYIGKEQTAVDTAMNALQNGAEAIHFIADQPFNIAALLEPLSDKNVPLYLELHFMEYAFAKALLEKSKALHSRLYLNIDPIGNLAKDGNWFESRDKDYTILKKLLATGGNILSIDTAHYQEAGATMTQQLAYSLNQVNEYFTLADATKLTVDNLTFKVTVGSNYFFEIAKIRALRKLFNTLCKEYTISSKTSCHILARPSRRNKTIYDYNTNMLRTTTECMSAILGGADTIINRPYDDLYHKTNDFGQRISRNQLIILKKESYFEAVSNPADGSYYIDALSQELAEKALHLFKEIEASGGLLKQLTEGTIQRKIKENAHKEQVAFDSGELVLLGTNMHPNTNDRMKETIELFPFVKHKPRKTLIEPIIQKRLAENLEKQRLEKEV